MNVCILCQHAEMYQLWSLSRLTFITSNASAVMIPVYSYYFFPYGVHIIFIFSVFCVNINQNKLNAAGPVY